MRRAAVLLLMMVSGCGTRTCKHDTALVTFALSDGLVADALDVSISIGGAAAQHGAARPLASGSIEVNFANGYPSGQSLTVVLTASSGGKVIGAGSNTVDLQPGCTALQIDVLAVAAPDLSTGADLAPDLAPDLARDLGSSRDLSLPLANGDRCNPGDPCASGHCVDGVCCDTACTGQCQACDIPDIGGKPGTCTTVTSGGVHGTRTVCADDGTGCGGACAGDPTQCGYPTHTCGAPAGCAHGALSSAVSCSLGKCPSPTPTPCPLSICGATGCAQVMQVATGSSATYAALSDGSVAAWGYNGNGELGVTPLASGEFRDHPALIPGLTGVMRVAAGGGHACALLSDNTLQCWGSNTSGELGIGSADQLTTHTPAPVLGTAGSSPLGNVASIAAGMTGTCAILNDQSLVCWGDNAMGAFGAGPAQVTRPLPFLGSTKVIEVGVGSGFVCAHVTSGQVLCSGYNGMGTLGRGTSDGNSHPSPMPALLSGPVSSLVVGDSEACAVDGSSVKCWGFNQNGSIGHGSFAEAPSPSPVPVCENPGCSTPLTFALPFAVGDSHVCAITNEEALLCWGEDYDGELGDNLASYQGRDIAGTAPLIGRVIGAAAGTKFTCALIAGGVPGCPTCDSTVQCWGFNDYGQVGVAAGGFINKPTTPDWTR